MDINELHEGDLIFIAIPSFLYRRVALHTGSKASHVGIILKDDDGNWIVAESAVPLSKYSTYDNFISRTEDDWYCIRRLKKPITSQQLETIKAECDKRMGIFYHLGFKFDSNRLFCSKFVFEVFKSALGISVGKLETLKEIYTNLPGSSLTFWRIWYFGFIPWSRITVTPASQMESDLLDTIYENNS